jgi:predicted nucleic acid-binding protein
MGLILDSSVLIVAERKGSNARQALNEIAARAAGEEVALSVVTLIELAHGAARADTPERKTMRQQFLHELTAALPVHPVTVSVALRAGQIDEAERRNQDALKAASTVCLRPTAGSLDRSIGRPQSLIKSLATDPVFPGKPGLPFPRSSPSGVLSAHSERPEQEQREACQGGLFIKAATRTHTRKGLDLARAVLLCGLKVAEKALAF